MCASSNGRSSGGSAIHDGTSRVECAAVCGSQSEAPSTKVSLLEVACWVCLPHLTSSSHDTSALNSEPKEDHSDDYLTDIAGLYEKATSNADLNSQNSQPSSTAATLEEPSTRWYPPISLLLDIETRQQGQTNTQSPLSSSGTQIAPPTNSIRTHNGFISSADPVHDSCNCLKSPTATSHACVHGTSPDIPLSAHLSIFHFCLSANDRRAKFEESSAFPAPNALQSCGSEACKNASPIDNSRNKAAFSSYSESSPGAESLHASRSSKDETPPYHREPRVENEDYSIPSTVGPYTRRPSNHHSFLQ